MTDKRHGACWMVAVVATGTCGTFTEAVPTLSKTVCRKSPAAYLASVSAKALARSVSPMAVFVSTIFRRICL